MNRTETGQVHSGTVWLRPSRFTSNCGLTEYDAGSVPEGDITYLRQAASFDIHQTDTGPANFMDVELIPLCGFGHTEEKWLTTSERCIRNVLAFDIAALLQTLAECGHQASGVATDVASCCARAASGQTAAPPSSVMIWRRLISSMGSSPEPAVPAYSRLRMYRKRL